MTPIHCKRPPELLPKAVGYTQVVNFFGPAGLLAAITVQGQVFIAHESADKLSMRASDGSTIDKGPVFRFVAQHLQALKNGTTPALLSSADARKRSPVSP